MGRRKVLRTMNSLQESASVCNQARTEQKLKDYLDYYRGHRKERPQGPKPHPSTFDVRKAVKALGPLGAGEAKALVKEAPELDAYELDSDTWVVKCGYCRDLHYHYAQPGYREAVCGDVLHLGNMTVERIDSPYKETGYILRKAMGARAIRLPSL